MLDDPLLDLNNTPIREKTCMLKEKILDHHLNHFNSFLSLICFETFCAFDDEKVFNESCLDILTVPQIVQKTIEHSCTIRRKLIIRSLADSLDQRASQVAFIKLELVKFVTQALENGLISWFLTLLHLLDYPLNFRSISFTFQLPLEVLQIRPVPQIFSKVVLDQSGSRLTDLNLEKSLEHLAQLLLLPE